MGNAIKAGIEANKRRSESIARANAALDVLPDLEEAARAMLKHVEFYQGHYHPSGKRELPKLMKALRSVLASGGSNG